MLRGAYGYGTCLSKLVSHPFSQTIPMARKKKKKLKSMQGVGECQKIQGCSGGQKVHDRFLEISIKTSTF